MTNDEIRMTKKSPPFRISSFGLRHLFGFRVSSFGFPVLSHIFCSMKLIHTRATWGIDLPFEQQLDLIKADGYAAVEAGGGYPDAAKTKDLLAARGLQFIPMV